jgi:hypothetical protein
MYADVAARSQGHYNFHYTQIFQTQRRTMSIIVVYYDHNKSVVCSDDRISREDPATLAITRIDGRASKIVVLPRNIVFGTVGRTDVGEKLFRMLTRMCGANDLAFEWLAEALPSLLRFAWARRAPTQLSAKVNKQDSLLLGKDRGGAIKCYVFRSENDFQPIETTLPGHRVAVLGAFELVDEKRLQDFTMDVGLKGERQKAPWIASKIRNLIDEISALHSESIGQASYFTAINRDGSIALPPEFPPPPTVDETESAQRAALAQVGRFFVGSIRAALAGPGRFFVGSIRTPVSGGLDTAGNGDGGSGAQYGTTTVLQMALTSTVSQSGNGTLTNPANAVDGDPNTFATIAATGNSALNSINLGLQGVPASISGAAKSAILRVTYSVPTNSLNGVGPVVSIVPHSQGNYGGPIIGGTDLVDVNPGVTVAKTTVTLDLLANGINNLSQVFLIFAGGCGTSSTSGSLALRIYDVSVVVEE